MPGANSRRHHHQQQQQQQQNHSSNGFNPKTRRDPMTRCGSNETSHAAEQQRKRGADRQLPERSKKARMESSGAADQSRCASSLTRRVRSRESTTADDDDVLRRLTTPVVAEMVLASMENLPEQMPPSFRAEYARASQADVSEWRRQIARALTSSMESESIQSSGKPIERESNGEIDAREARSIHDVGLKSSMTSSEPVKDTREVPHVVLPITDEERKRLIETCTEKLNRSVYGGFDVHVRRNVHSKLLSACDDLANDHVRLFVSKLEKDSIDRAVSFTMDLYLNYKTSPKDRQPKLLCHYEQCVSMILDKLFHHPDFKDADSFKEILLSAPLLSPGIFESLRRLDVVESSGATKLTDALRDVLAKRAPARAECYDLLRHFSTHDQPDVRRRALELMESEGEQ